MFICLLCYGHGDHRDLHDRTPAIPTPRSSVFPRIAARSTGPKKRPSNELGTSAISRKSSSSASTWQPVQRGNGRPRRSLACRLAATRPLTETASSRARSEEHTSELQSLMRISYAVFCLKKKQNNTSTNHTDSSHCGNKPYKL